VPSLDDLAPVNWDGGKYEEVRAMLNSTDLAEVTIGAAGAPAEITLVLDFAKANSVKALLGYWPSVRDGGLRLRIVPARLLGKASGDASALLASAKPHELIRVYLRHWGGPGGKSLIDAAYSEPNAQNMRCVTSGASGCNEKHDAEVARLIGSEAARTEKNAAVERHNELVRSAKLRALPLHITHKGNGDWYGFNGLQTLDQMRNEVWKDLGVAWSFVYDSDRQVNILRAGRTSGYSMVDMSVASLLGDGSGSVDMSSPSAGVAKSLYTREVCSAIGECWKAPEEKKAGFSLF